MTKYTFVKVPGYHAWTGDKRIQANLQRTEFVAFVINLDTMQGSGIKGPVLQDIKTAVEHFMKHYSWPDGAKI